jgi:hypothetical protein
MILNDKPNCQVSRILMNPRPILFDSSENDPGLQYANKFQTFSELLRSTYYVRSGETHRHIIITYKK